MAGAETPRRDSYSCVQVDDLANPWGFYAVAEGGASQDQNFPQFPELAPRLAADVPGMLARNPRVHQNPCRALYETHRAASKVASSGNIYPETTSALSLAMLQEEFLHIAWDGDAKIV